MNQNIKHNANKYHADIHVKRVLVAGATGYLGRFVVKAFKQQGYWVRVLTRSEERLFSPGPFHSPAISKKDVDEIFVGEITQPKTLQGLMAGIDLVFSCVGISRQRDGLTFEQVDYQGNKRLIELSEAADVKRFVYVSMQGAEKIMHLEITQAHEKVVELLKSSKMDYRIIRPCGYYSDMGALYDMAKKGRGYLIGSGSNRMNPIYGGDLADICVLAAKGDDYEVEAGGPEIMTQREALELAFDVLGKRVKITRIPMWVSRSLVILIRLFSKQFGDLADFIVTAGKIDGIGPTLGKMTLRSYFEYLQELDEQSTQ